MSKYRKVWVDRDGDVFQDEPGPAVTEIYGPHVEYILAPADAIVIERGDLPEVARFNDHGDLIVEATVYGGVRTPEYAEAVARRWLAMAEYLRANPPVDESQVRQIADAIGPSIWTKVGDGGVESIARSLYLAGIRAPEVTE